MRNLYLLNYNNYYNRIIKKFDKLAPYEDYLCADIARNVNFIPGDGIRTNVIINTLNFNIYNTPDYLLVVDNNGNIESRWFVLTAERTSNGQYRLGIKRDCVADNLTNILNATSFIYKGTVLPGDIAIYNSEGITLNQIKTSEILLKDYTNMPWIVAYISPDVAADQGDIIGNIEGYFDNEYDSLEDYPYYDYFNNNYSRLQDTFIEIPVKVGIYKHDLRFNCSSKIVSDASPSSNVGEVTISASDTSNIVFNIQKNFKNVSNSSLRLDNYINVLTDQQLNDLLEQDNKVINAGGKLYKITARKHYSEFISNIDIGSSTDIAIQSCFWKDPNNPMQLLTGITTSLSTKQYAQQVSSKIYWYGTIYTLEYEEMSEDPSGEFKFNFSGINLANTETPYGILCMPYEDSIHITGPNGEQETGNLLKEMRLKIFQALGSISSLLYDIQLLPYCPITNLNILNNEINVPTGTAQLVKVTISDGIGITDQYLTSMIVAPRANISFKIYNQPINITNVKMQNDTDLWRLCSPNYSGVFEFNAAKFYTGSNTVINYFTVDCTFKPYTPYIHVAPEFNGLYGKDFADSRGLICGGDFSVDRISDAWETYQYNNKNFQLQFDRQIDTMELQKGWNIAGNVINGIGSAVSNGIALGFLGGPAGAVAGAAAGIIDAGFNTAESVILQQDQIDAAKQQQAWSLENIKAQPYGLTKVNALNKNNKLFPFIEYYTCSNEEKELYLNKIKYEGMTVNRVDKISNYIYTDENNYINARIIRSDIKNNAAMLNDINNELKTGVYIYAN